MLAYEKNWFKYSYVGKFVYLCIAWRNI